MPGLKCRSSARPFRPEILSFSLFFRPYMPGSCTASWEYCARGGGNFRQARVQGSGARQSWAAGGASYQQRTVALRGLAHGSICAFSGISQVGLRFAEVASSQVRGLFLVGWAGGKSEPPRRLPVRRDRGRSDSRGAHKLRRRDLREPPGRAPGKRAFRVRNCIH